MKLFEYLLSLYTLYSKKASSLLTFSGQQSHFYVSLTTCMNKVLDKIINKIIRFPFFVQSNLNKLLCLLLQKVLNGFFNLVFMAFR